MRWDVFGVELNKLSFLSPAESGHPNSAWSCCFRNDVFRHSVIAQQCIVSADCWWSTVHWMILAIIWKSLHFILWFSGNWSLLFSVF